MVHALLLSAASGRVYEQTQTAGKGATLLRVECFSPTPVKPSVVCFCVLGDRQLAAVDSRGNAYILSLDQNRYRRICTNLPSTHSLVPIDSDTVALACGKEVKVYQSNGQLLATLRGHKDAVESLDSNPLRRWLLTQSQDTVIIWEIGTWRRVRTVNTEASKYVLCKFSPDSQSLLVNLKDGSLHQMGLAKFATEKTFKGAGGIRLFCCNATFTQVFGISGGAIVTWNCASPQGPKSSLQLPDGISSVLQFTLVADSHFLLLADNGVLYVVSVAGEKTVGEIRAENASILGVSVARGTLGFRASDGSAKVIAWDELIRELEGKPQTHVKLRKETFDVPAEVPAAKPASQPSSSDHSVVILRKEGLDFNNVSTSSQSTDAPQPCQHQLFAEIFRNAKASPEQSRLQHCTLRKLLHFSGEYPAQYRVMIWRFLLQLPNNKEAFEGLYSKGMHPALSSLHRNPLLKPPQLYAKLERVLSALAYWSPIFGEADFVPGLLRALAVACRGDDLSLFEASAALFTNWLQHWLEFYPTPPLNYLQSIDNLLKHHQPRLHAHLQALKCQPKVYIWPSLQHLFAAFWGVEGVTQLLDFLFTDWDKPQLLLFFAAALLIKHKNILLKMTKSSEISAFFTTPRAVKVTKIAAIAFDLFNETPADVAIVGFDQRLPIPIGQYPLFTGYPKFIVEERQGIREEILRGEELLMQKEATAAELATQVADLEEKEKLQTVKKEQIAQLDREWRDLAQMEEQLRAQERLAFEKETSLRKQRDISELEARFQEQTEGRRKAREQELKALEKEVARGALSGQYALEAAIAEEALRALEQRATKSIQTTIEERTTDELKRRQLLIESEYKEQVDLKDRLTQAQWQREDEAAQLRLQLQQEREDQTTSTRRLADAALVLEKAQQLQTLEHDLKLLEVSKERRLRQLAEEELQRGRTAADLQRQKRDILTAEEAHHFADLRRREQFHEKKLAEERMNLVQSATVANQKDLLTQQDEIQRLEREKQRKEAEGRLIELRKESEQRALDAERQFQQEVLQMDAEAREKRQTNLERLFAQKEEEEKLYFQRVIQNEKAGLEKKADAERTARMQQVAMIEEQRRRTQRAQEELARAHREKLEQENDLQRLRMVQETLQTRSREATRKPDSPPKSSESSMEGQDALQARSRRAVTFHSTYTSPNYTNRSPDCSAQEHGSECSCSCHSASGSSTPPLPTRSVHEEEYSSGELSDGSELILSHSGSSFTSKYSSLSNSRR